MSHILIFMYCYGFIYDLIGYIEFQFLIRLYVNFLRLQIENLYYILTINHLLKFESAFEVISIGHFELQLTTIFNYSILRLQLKNSFHLFHSIHF